MIQIQASLIVVAVLGIVGLVKPIVYVKDALTLRQIQIRNIKLLSFQRIKLMFNLYVFIILLFFKNTVLGPDSLHQFTEFSSQDLVDGKILRKNKKI